jgi:hypothetical protein
MIAIRFVAGGSLYVNWEGAGGVVGDTVTVDFTVAGLVSAVHGPIAGAGMPGQIASGGLLVWWRRKRKAGAVAAIPTPPRDLQPYSDALRLNG